MCNVWWRRRRRRAEVTDLIVGAQQSRLQSMDALRKELDSAFNAQVSVQPVLVHPVPYMLHEC
jgi:hypothetical protein